MLAGSIAPLVVLAIASAAFHWHFAGPAGVAPIIVLALCTYGAGIALGGVAGRRALFVAACGLAIGALGFYKYSEFLLAMLGSALAAADTDAQWLRTWSAPAAPLAISFFTFEFVHYLYEVRVHGREPIRNPLHFTVFAIFFPSLASGPFVTRHLPAGSS